MENAIRSSKSFIKKASSRMY